jgi:hypothetical protein
MGVMLVLRWVWWRVTAWGEIAAIAASLVLAPALLLALPAEREALRLLILALGSACAGIAASLLSRPESDERLIAFYERARPPGFWGPVARVTGRDDKADRRRLARGLAATFLGAFSIFCLLVGLGSWLAGSPPPTWFAARGPWIATLLIAGIALTPVWMRLGFGEDPD